MSELSSKPVSELLEQWQAGDAEALEALLPLVYQELRRLARNHLRKERPDHTLQSVDLVHEAYLRLAGQVPVNFANRAHFFAISAGLMRQVLMHHARRRNAVKRDGGHRVALDGAALLPKDGDVDLIALDDALKGLAHLDPRQGRIVELRFFGGLTIEETAAELNLSPATIKREWDIALRWLRHEMRASSPRDGDQQTDETPR
jgi:RNA polymerase sigma factor (TIGR02999 family)